MFKPSALLLLLPWIGLAQLTPNSVTVTASRNAPALQPDQVTLGISIASGADATRDDALAAAQGAGLTPANFAGVNYDSSQNAPLPLTWNFTSTVKISDMKATVGLLTGLQKNLARDGKFGLSFSVQGTGVSQQAQSCSFTDLMADARAQATKLAAGAGLGVGAVQAVSGSTTAVASTVSAIGGVSGSSSPACSITVKFALGGF